GGSTTLGYISNWDNLQLTGNTFIGGGELFVLNTPVGKTVANYNWNNNTYYSSGSSAPIGYKPGGEQGRNYSFQDWQRLTGADSNGQAFNGRPTGTKVVIRPNFYAPGRAHVAVYNWDLRNMVDVDFSRQLRLGDRYEIRDLQDYFGPPILSGIYNGKPMQLPMNIDGIRVT